MQTLDDNQVISTEQTEETTATEVDTSQSENLDANAQSVDGKQEEVVMPKLRGCQIKQYDSKYRKVLIFSALGIVLSPFVIIGLIFAVFGLMSSRNQLTLLKMDNAKPSQTVLWAFWLGVTGIIVNAGVLLFYILFAIL